MRRDFSSFVFLDSRVVNGAQTVEVAVAAYKIYTSVNNDTGELRLVLCDLIPPYKAIFSVSSLGYDASDGPPLDAIISNFVAS